MRFLTVFSLFLMSLAAVPAVRAQDTTELSIVRMTPDGADVPPPSQIVFSFNRPVVPLGRMERAAAEIPVIITPSLTCQWRWIDSQNLACQLDEKNQPKKSTAYKIVMNPGIKAEDGATLNTPFEGQFITERADPRYTWHTTWRGPGSPVIRMTLNQAVTAESLRASLVFTMASGAQVKPTVKPDENDSEAPVFIVAPESRGFFAFFDTTRRKSDDDVKKTGDGTEARRIWIIEPEKELPLDTSISLRLSPGLISAEGPEPSVAARDLVVFDTFPDFSFIGVKCMDNDDKELLITAANTQDVKCNPMAPVRLAFSTPIFKSQVRDHIVFTPALANKDNHDDIWGDLADEYSRLGTAHEKGRTYDVYLPYGLKAETTYKIELPKKKLSIWKWVKSFFVAVPHTDLNDEFGRAIASAFDLTFTIDARRPNFELDYHDAVLESQMDSDVPLYVNNLKSYTYNYKILTPEKTAADQKMARDVPQVANVQFAVPFGLREALGGKSGAVFGSFTTDPPVRNKYPYDYRLFAQVTPWQMHVKIGHFSTLVWLTDMTTGAPVAGTDISLFKSSVYAFDKTDSVLAKAVTDQDGIARLPGTETLDPELKTFSVYEDNEDILFVRAVKGDAQALMPISNNYIIDTWRASNESVQTTYQKKFGHMASWGTTAQGIYRAGDSIQYKIYVRQQDDRMLIPAPVAGYKLEIIDPMNNVVETRENVGLNDFGSFDGDYAVPASAPVGWYKFKLSASFTGSEGACSEDDDYCNEQEGRIWYPLRVLVTDFTPSPFKVTNSLNGDYFEVGSTVDVQSAAQMHAGGPYTDASVRVTAILEPRGLTPKSPVAQGYYFATNTANWNSSQIFQQSYDLDQKGEYAAKFTIPEQSIVYGRLKVESAVQDDRGKTIAGMSEADYAGLDRFVGLKSTDWVFTAKEEAKVMAIVVDGKGMVAEGVPVKIDIQRAITQAARVKGAGNAYITNFTTDWKSADTCNITSGKDGVACAFTPSAAGSYRAVASITDTKGRRHETTLGLWVAGGDYVLWDSGSDVLLPIIPEKTEYKVGDTAHYLIKNPYPGATALITVERYGIIDSFTRKLDGSAVVIDLPIKPDYLPGFYLSVVVTSPRADKPVEDGQLDLGKPTFRMGYVTVPVRDASKEIDVKATVDRDVYRPRDKVSVILDAKPRVTLNKKAPIEFAVAVLDESVLDLVAGGVRHFDPYQGFYALKGLDLRNFSLLTRLIGRQKFEKKGANPGGDGGADLSMRDVFKYVAYWNPSLKADAAGKAAFDFAVPDNLTGWRVLALAVTPGDRMGLGQARFKVNKPTEIRPLMPNQVTEGDTFKAGFSIMNRSDKERSLKIMLKAEGDIEKPAETQQTITLAPYKRGSVYLDVTAKKLPVSRENPIGRIHFTAAAKDDTDGDLTIFDLPVNKQRSLDVAAVYGTTDAADPVSVSLDIPKNIKPDVGDVQVVLTPTVIGAVEGAFRYMKLYPYICWEQILTKGVMASHYQNLRQYMPGKIEWPGSETLPQTTLDMAARFQAPNGGMTYFVAQDTYVDPYLSAYTAIAFNWMRQAGYKVPVQLESKLQDYLQNLLRNNVMPTFYDEGMQSTVRAVALAALAENGKITREDVTRYQPFLKQMSLFGKAHFLKAAVKLAPATATEAAKAILAMGNQTAGKFVFNEELDDSYSRILSSPLRENCAVMDAFASYAQASDEGRKLVGDTPFRMVRYITETRKNRDHWENTQENMFCMQALVAYSKTFESVKPNMTVTAAMAGKAFGNAAFDDWKNAPVTLARPLVAEDAGQKTSVIIERKGEGRLYYATRLSYATDEASATDTNAGMELHREYSVEGKDGWQLIASGAAVKKGDIVRVDLYLTLPAARNFVVVNDAVPGGLEPVNRDLANASQVDADKGAFTAAGGSWFFKFSDWVGYNVSRWSFYHQELRHDSVRFYADYLPPGNYHLSYAAQAIADGSFTVMPALAEEMYNPDTYGKAAGTTLHVETQQ